MKGWKRKALAAVLAIELAAICFFAGRLTLVEHKGKYEAGKDPAEIYVTAQNYLDAGYYSEEGLIRALSEYEHFDEYETRKVVESLDVEWQTEADEELSAYLKMTGNSEKQIREYLKRDHFTEEQIDEAINKADPDWHEQAVRCADYLKKSGADDNSIRLLLLERGFKEEDL